VATLAAKSQPRTATWYRACCEHRISLPRGARSRCNFCPHDGKQAARARCYGIPPYDLWEASAVGQVDTARPACESGSYLCSRGLRARAAHPAQGRRTALYTARPKPSTPRRPASSRTLTPPDLHPHAASHRPIRGRLVLDMLTARSWSKRHACEQASCGNPHCVAIAGERCGTVNPRLSAARPPHIARPREEDAIDDREVVHSRHPRAATNTFHCIRSTIEAAKGLVRTGSPHKYWVSRTGTTFVPELHNLATV